MEQQDDETRNVSNDDDRRVPSLIRQVHGALQGWTTGLLYGMQTAYVSVGMDSFQNDFNRGHAPFKVSDMDVGTFGSAISVGGILGALCSGCITKTFGRKLPSILTLIPFMAGWALIAFPTSFPMLVAGQAISSFAQGIHGPVSRTYLAELSHPRYRGRFLAGVSITATLARLAVYSAALLLNWQQMAIGCGLAPLLLIPLLVKVPESPVWLVTKERQEEARLSLQWFYGKKCNIEPDLQEVVSHHKETKEALAHWKDILQLRFLKPVIMVSTFVVLIHLCGGVPVQFFTTQILRKSSTSLDPKYGVIVLGGVQLVALSLAGFMVDIMGRRKCVLVSGVWVALAQAAVGAYFYLHDDSSRKVLTDRVPWLPVVLLSLSMIGFNLGMFPLFYVLVGELIPIQIKDQAIAFLNVLNNASTFMEVLLFHYFTNRIGTSVTFWIYSGCCCSLVVFMTMNLKETKGQSLSNIERQLTKSNT